jgi:hypothetical protein
VLALHPAGHLQGDEVPGLPVLGLSVSSFAGTDPDTDLDGSTDSFDNCTVVVNSFLLPASGCTAQQDGLTAQNPNEPDGYGTVCDTDFNNNGATDSSDLGQMLIASTNVSADVDKDLNCNGAADSADLGVTLADLANVQTPAPSGYACAGTIPCP